MRAKRYGKWEAYPEKLCGRRGCPVYLEEGQNDQRKLLEREGFCFDGRRSDSDRRLRRGWQSRASSDLGAVDTSRDGARLRARGGAEEDGYGGCEPREPVRFMLAERTMAFFSSVVGACRSLV